jgi:ankyrin repeat protein
MSSEQTHHCIFDHSCKPNRAQHIADVNAHDETRTGETQLGAASPHCSFEMAELLIKSGADPSIPGWMGITAIHRAKDREDDDGQRVFDLLIKASGKSVGEMIQT